MHHERQTFLSILSETARPFHLKTIQFTTSLTFQLFILPDVRAA